MADSKQSLEPITLPASNPYANGRQLVFTTGDAKLVRDKIEYVPKEADDFYVVKIDDLLTRIAYDFYKEKVQLPHQYWWVIADANNIRNPLDLTGYVGTEIVIPDILNFKLNN